MENLKALFGTEALTWEQLETKLKDNKDVKLANLAGGGYVDKKKYDDEVTKLATANETIKGLQATVAKFDGVDVEKLKTDAKDWETKYNNDIAAVKLESAVNMALVESKVKNTKIAKAALDMSLVKLDGDKLLGLSEQLENLKKSDAYLFDVEDTGNGGNGGTRVNTGNNHSGCVNADTFLSAMRAGAGLDKK